MALLSKEQIVAADDIAHEDVDVPEWGGQVRVRGLTGSQRSLVNGTILAVKGQAVSVRTEALASMMERLVAMSLVDTDGNRLFSDAEVSALGAKNAGVIQRLFAKAQQLSGLTEQAVEDLAGNSDATQNDDSSSV